MDKEILDLIDQTLQEEGIYYIGKPLSLKSFKLIYPLTDEGFNEEEICDVKPVDCTNAFYWVKSKFAMSTGRCQCSYKDWEWALIYYVATLRILASIYWNPEEDKSALNEYTLNIMSSFGVNNVKWAK